MGSEAVVTALMRLEYRERRRTRRDAFIAKFGGTHRIVRFSQPRATKQTLGIYDRRFRVAGVVFWWDYKREGSCLRAEQIDFGESELAYSCPVGCGTLTDLIGYVNALMPLAAADRTHYACLMGRKLIEQYRPKAKRARRGKL